jgi:hypothetical protein
MLTKFELSELVDHAEGLIREIDDGRYEEDGDLSYQVALAHLQDHLNLAWHAPRMTNEEFNSLSQTQFEAAMLATPKLQVGQHLVEAWQRPEDVSEG